MQDIIAKAKALLARMKEAARSMRRSVSEEAGEFIREAETEEVFVAEATKDTVGRRWASVRGYFSSLLGKLSRKEQLVIIFAIGLVIGFGVKVVSNEYVTIGYRDYTARNAKAYDLIALQKKVSENSSGSAFSGGGAAGGGTCSQ
jgi:hypothetical protein